jgi:ribonuclease Z
MARLHLLGTGAAVSDPERTTTMLAFTEGPETLVVDCGGDVVQRLLAAGIDLETIAALIVTHEHPDHVSGFPLFMEKIWLAGRRRPIAVYGIGPATDQARRCFETFDTSRWEGLPEIAWKEVPHEEAATVLDTEMWHVLASPGKHSVPTVGLRLTSKTSGGVVTYSCDTEPYGPIERLAVDADILVHEATGPTPGHSSAAQAAKISSKAGVRQLILVHLPPLLPEDDVKEARAIFSATELGADLGTYDF